MRWLPPLRMDSELAKWGKGRVFHVGETVEILLVRRDFRSCSFASARYLLMVIEVNIDPCTITTYTAHSIRWSIIISPVVSNFKHAIGEELFSYRD